MFKIIICIFSLHSLGIAKPWPDVVLAEFRKLGELVLGVDHPKRLNTFNITESLRGFLFISKGKNRLKLKRHFNYSLSCQLSGDGQGINLTRDVCDKFKNFFKLCTINGSIEQPNIESSNDNEAEVPARTDQPEDDRNIQSALSASSPVLRPPHHGSPIVCVGPETDLDGQATNYYLCYHVPIPTINHETTLRVIDLLWDEEIEINFQKLGDKVLEARLGKQSIEVHEGLIKVLFKQTDIGIFELKSFSQAPVNVRVSFDGKNMKVSLKALNGLKRFFANCRNTRFEKPTITAF